MRFASSRILPMGLALLAGSLPLAGCSNPRAASKANFMKVLAPVVADDFCSGIRAERLTTNADTSAPLPPFPIVVRAIPQGFDESRANLDAWTKAGLLTRTERTVPAADWHGTEPLKPVDTVTYAPTDAGKPVFRGIDGKLTDGTIAQFPAACRATGKVSEIVRWTEPATIVGATYVEVTYRYVGADPTPIASKAEGEQMAQPHEAKVTLVQTNDGWSTGR